MNQHALTPVDSLPRPDPGIIMEEVIIKGDLAKLSPEARARYYTTFCQSVGLNPQTQPLAYITLNGKLTLYALKGATDQLRKVHGVSIVRVDKEIIEDLYVVTVAVRDATGRIDEDMGAAPIAGLKGEAKVNAMLKAITKAKRRATLSICGLGLLDETEVDSIPGAHIVRVDTETGEILDGEVASQPKPLAAKYPPREAKSLYPPPSTTTGPSVASRAAADDDSGIQSKAEEYRRAELKRYHAITDELGLSEAAQALFAHALGKTDSRSTLTGGELADLTDFAAQELRRTGEDGLINPLTECANKIAAAADDAALTEVVRGMVEGGLIEEFLVAMGKRRRAELQQG
jgi:hypothetical protein